MAWKYGCISFLCRRWCLKVNTASNANTAWLQTMGVLGIAPRALSGLYSSVLGLAQAASSDLWWQAGSVSSGAGRAGRGGAKVMVRTSDCFCSGWRQEKPKGNISHSGDTKSHALPHAEATSTFIAPCSLLLLPGVDVGWSSVHSVSKASQLYITLFLY